MLYSGDEYYGDEITSPLARHIAPMRLAVAARGTCPACGSLHHIQRCPTVAALRDAPDGTDVRGLAACLEASHAD